MWEPPGNESQFICEIEVISQKKAIASHSVVYIEVYIVSQITRNQALIYGLRNIIT